MQNYKTIAMDLINSLEKSPYFVYGGEAEGLSVLAVQNAKELIFSYNLGATFVPTKAQATEMLYKLTRHYDSLN